MRLERVPFGRQRGAERERHIVFRPQMLHVLAPWLVGMPGDVARLGVSVGDDDVAVDAHLWEVFFCGAERLPLRPGEVDEAARGVGSGPCDDMPPAAS